MNQSGSAESAIAPHKGGDALLGKGGGQFRAGRIGQKPVIVGMHVNEPRGNGLMGAVNNKAVF